MKQEALPEDASEASKRVLEPIERISEVLFGLIMVLTFTGSLSVAEAGREDVRTMLIGALGCNLAWGLIDGVMYLMACLSARAKGIRTVLAVRKAARPEQAHRLIAGVLPPLVAAVLQPAELERVRLHVNQLPEPAMRPRLLKQDWRGALAVFLIVFLSTFPVVLPFVFMHHALRALRFSNAIAIVLLFLTGYAFGRCTGHRPSVMGFSMVALGIVLVAITIALGG
ncbi:MAG: VIT1/CCC1 transporter family protein [Verrucomicrobiota bacterium]